MKKLKAIIQNPIFYAVILSVIAGLNLLRLVIGDITGIISLVVLAGCAVVFYKDKGQWFGI